jgi:hypothetical protein
VQRGMQQAEPIMVHRKPLGYDSSELPISFPPLERGRKMQAFNYQDVDANLFADPAPEPESPDPVLAAESVPPLRGSLPAVARRTGSRPPRCQRSTGFDKAVIVAVFVTDW